MRAKDAWDYIGGQIGSSCGVSVLSYADDGALMHISEQTFGRNVNTTETKVMLSSLALDDDVPIIMFWVGFETIDSFKYIDSLISNTGQEANQFKHHLDRPWTAFIRLQASYIVAEKSPSARGLKLWDPSYYMVVRRGPWTRRLRVFSL